MQRNELVHNCVHEDKRRLSHLFDEDAFPREGFVSFQTLQKPSSAVGRETRQAARNVVIMRRYWLVRRPQLSEADISSTLKHHQYIMTRTRYPYPGPDTDWEPEARLMT